MQFKKITIIKTSIPKGIGINEKMLLFGGSLGLFSDRDKDKSCYRIFIVFIKNLNKDGMTSDEIATKTGLTRGTVVHHLNKLMDSEIIINSRNKYFLNVKNTQQLIERVKSNLNSTLDNLSDVAKELDEQLGLD